MCWDHPDVFQSALLVFIIGLTDKMESLGNTMKCVQPSAHPGYTDFWCGEGFVVRLCEDMLEVYFLYFRVGCSLQNGEDNVLSKCSTIGKATIISLISVRPSVCPRGTTWLPLDGFLRKIIFRQLSKTRLENMVISGWVLFGERNFTDRCTGGKTHTALSVTFLRNSCRLWDNMEELCSTEQSTDTNITGSMRCTCWITKATDTHWE